MDSEIPFWTLEYEGDDGYSWRNTQNDTELAVLFDDEINSWVVTGQNSRLTTVESKEDGYEFAIEYMQNHPRPSSMV